LSNISFILGRLIILNSLDFLLCYVITNNIIGNKIKYTFKSFTYKDAFLACSYIAIMTFWRLMENQFEIRHFGLAIITIALLMVMSSIVKKNNSKYTLDEIILMFFIHFLLAHIIIALSAIPFISLDENAEIIYLSISSILLIGFLFVIDKIDLNKLFLFIIHRLALKFAIFVTSFITLFIFIFVTVNHSLNASQTLIPLGVLAIIVIIGLIYILKAAHQYEIVIPEKYHDMKKILTLLNLKAEDVQTVEELREAIITTIELMGIKTADPELQKAKDEPEDFEAFIKATINSLKLNYKSTVEINANIQYFEPHKTINAMNISYMLGTLLENAIETRTEHPILVDILSTEHILFIKVANETESKTQKELNNMLVKGYSTKEKVGRGFGLSKLKKLVENHQGNITISQEVNVEAQANYIVFTLNF